MSSSSPLPKPPNSEDSDESKTQRRSSSGTLLPPNHTPSGIPKPTSFNPESRRRSDGGGIPRSPKQTINDPKRKKQPSHSHAAAGNAEYAFLTASDPAESSLIDVLEETTGGGESVARAKRPSNVRDRAAKMQHIVQQISSRKVLSSSYRRGDSADNEIKRSSSSSSKKVERTSSRDSKTKHYDAISTFEDLQSQDGSHSTQPNSNANRRRTASAAGYIEGRGGAPRRMEGAKRLGSNGRRTSGKHQQQQQAEGPTSDFITNLEQNLDDSDSDKNNENFGFQSTPEKAPLTEKKRFSQRGHHHRRMKTTADTFFDHAQHLENLFTHENQDDNELPGDFFRGSNRNQQEQQQQQQQRDGKVSPAYSDISDDDENDSGRDLEGGPGVTRPLLGMRRNNLRFSPAKRAYTYLLTLFAIMGPEDIWKGIRDFFFRTVLCIVVPLLLIASILFYYCKNPNLSLLPTDATLAWWLIFAVRLLMTYKLAQMSQYLLKIFTTRTTLMVRLAGPFVALVAMQSLGWPFLIASFGSWTMLLMHGDHPFVNNWLWFLNLNIFSSATNSDGGVLESALYGDFLSAMIFVGVATAAKRTVLALYLSRRMLQYYRRPVRVLLADMKMIMEVAELAAETETEHFAKLMEEEENLRHSMRTNDVSNPSAKSRNTIASEVALTALKGSGSKTLAIPRFAKPLPTADILSRPSTSSSEDEGDDSGDDDDDLIVSDDEDEAPQISEFTGTPMSSRSGKASVLSRLTSSTAGIQTQRTSVGSVVSRGPVQWSELKNQVKLKRTAGRPASPVDMMMSSSGAGGGTPRSKTTGLDKLVKRLEDWDEPEAKGAKKIVPSLYEILQFRKAMEFMENPYPFSVAFGLARNRKECVRSSARVYKRLLKFTPGESVLHFDIIGALAYDDDGDLDEKRVQSLLRVFTPSKDDLLSQLSFIQCVDYVYKHLRFLRASMLNSSKIDSVLEDVFDFLFYSVICVVVTTMVGVQIIPILAGVSTVMVSFAFSFGPSCAKYIEGTLMIAVRRPFDIGDRITIIASESITQPTPSETWLVEDITLTTTTLRYSATNEVCSINNAAIANSRIVNGARSDKAIVTITIRFNVLTTHEEIEIFRIRVENYLKDKPEIWAGLVHFRNDEIDHNWNYVTYLMRVQHQRSWQDMPPVMVHKGELQSYADKVATQMGIVWQSPHHRVRIMEMPTLRQTKETESNEGNQDVAMKEEPFLKFIKEQTGLP